MLQEKDRKDTHDYGNHPQSQTNGKLLEPTLYVHIKVGFKIPRQCHVLIDRACYIDGIPAIPGIFNNILSVIKQNLMNEMNSNGYL